MTSRGVEKMNHDTIGVDVSKDHLDAHRLNDGASRRFANDKRGHKHSSNGWWRHRSRVVFDQQALIIAHRARARRRRRSVRQGQSASGPPFR